MIEALQPTSSLQLTQGMLFSAPNVQARQIVVLPLPQQSIAICVGSGGPTTRHQQQSEHQQLKPAACGTAPAATSAKEPA